jgi:hypothetical protein
MSLKMKGIVPIFEASSAVAAALDNEESARAGAVIVADGSGLVLHHHAALTHHRKAPTLGALAGQSVETLDARAMEPAGIGAIEAMPHTSPTHTAGLVSPLSRQVAMLFEDADGSFRIVATQRWQCDPHKETYIRRRGGPCPNHSDGTLKPIP